MQPIVSPESPFTSPHSRPSRSDTRRDHMVNTALNILSIDNQSSHVAGGGGDKPTPPTADELSKMTDVELAHHGYIRVDGTIVSLKVHNERKETEEQRGRARLEAERIVREREEQAKKNFSFLDDPEKVQEILGRLFDGHMSPLTPEDRIIHTSYQIFGNYAPGSNQSFSIDITCTLAHGDEVFLSLGNESLEDLAEVSGTQDEIMHYLGGLELDTVTYTMRVSEKDQQTLLDAGEIDPPYFDVEEGVGFVEFAKGGKYAEYRMQSEGEQIGDPEIPFPNRKNCQIKVDEFIGFVSDDIVSDDGEEN